MKSSALKSRLSAILRSKKTLVICITVLILALITALFFVFVRKPQNETPQTTDKIYSSRGESLKDNVNTDEGKRKYFTYLMARDQDEEAKRLVEELVASTGDINDAISLLNFCVTNNIGPDKVECAKNSFKIIENKASQLNFHQAYSTAEMVESLKNNKLAGILYQQALDKYFEYTPNKEVKLMSENQLTIKIEDLKK